MHSSEIYETVVEFFERELKLLAELRGGEEFLPLVILRMENDSGLSVQENFTLRPSLAADLRGIFRSLCSSADELIDKGFLELGRPYTVSLLYGHRPDQSICAAHLTLGEDGQSSAREGFALKAFEDEKKAAEGTVRWG